MSKIVIKIGGNSLYSAEQIKKIPAVLREHPDDKIVLIISALGKSTRNLRELAKAYYGHSDMDEINEMTENIESFHRDIMEDLFPKDDVIFGQAEDIFSDLVTLGYHQRNVLSRLAHEDQIVSLGEILSVLIISRHLHQCSQTKDHCPLIMPSYNFVNTNLAFTEAKIDEDVTVDKVRRNYERFFMKTNIILGHGFIGYADTVLKDPSGVNLKLRTTTGTNSSDHTAALFAGAIGAEEIFFYKGVPGLMNVDPNVPGGEEAKIIRDASFDRTQAIVEKGTGRGLLHPLTIPTLRKYNVPTCWIKNFDEPQDYGTRIS